MGAVLLALVMSISVLVALVIEVHRLSCTVDELGALVARMRNKPLPDYDGPEERFNHDVG